MEGDLIIKEDYYPWLKKRFLGGERESAGFKGNSQYFYLMYKALNAKNIYFEPIVHSDFIVRSEGPKVKAPGNYTRIIYPDGSIEEDGRNGPDFEKLQAIRQAAERYR